LKKILRSCQSLESINVWCGDGYLNEKEFLEVVAKYSPENFHQLEIYYTYNANSVLRPDELEEFFVNWKNRESRKPLSLIVIKDYKSASLEVNVENTKIIEKYAKIGLVKKFVVKEYKEEN
jgi:hypothetical protein